MSELKDGKHIKLKEYILYVLAVFFYTNMTGMINEYRRTHFRSRPTPSCLTATRSNTGFR